MKNLSIVILILLGFANGKLFAQHGHGSSHHSEVPRQAPRMSMLTRNMGSSNAKAHANSNSIFGTNKSHPAPAKVPPHDNKNIIEKSDFNNPPSHKNSHPNPDKSNKKHKK